MATWNSIHVKRDELNHYHFGIIAKYMSFQLEIGFYCVKHCGGVWKKTFVNSVRVDD